MGKYKDYTGIVTALIDKLNDSGVNCYLWHKATTGSLYIRFKDNRVGSVRIANHPGRSRLRYKYNLRSDIKVDHQLWVKDDNVWRCYLHMSKWQQLIPILIDRLKSVQNWSTDNKYEYFIPKFKQNEKIK